MVHVSVVVVQVALKSVSGFFLGIARLFRVVLVESVAIVPRGAVRLPRSQTHPAKFGPARLILADHVVAAAVFLYGHVTLGTLFGVGRNPIGRLRVVVAFFNPLFEPFASDRIVPELAAAETKHVTASALDWLRVVVLDFDCVGTIGCWTPAHQPIALDKTIRYQMLIFYFDYGI